MCVGAILSAGPAHLVFWNQTLHGSLQELACGVGTFPDWPAMVAIRVLFSLAGGSNLHHVSTEVGGSGTDFLTLDP